MKTDFVTIRELAIYPVKGCAGISLQRARVTVRGLQYDRSWMIVDKDAQFITQREIEKLALVRTTLDTSALTCDAPRVGSMKVPLTAKTGAGVRVRVWNDWCEAYDEGREANEWLNSFLEGCPGGPFRLVRFNPEFQRKINEKYAGNSGAHTAFADGYPLLVISKESLEDLNRRIVENGGAAIPINRFRPNLVIEGGGEYIEDRARSLSRGDALQFDLVKPCVRCKVTTVDQLHGVVAKGGEPLRTLATYRRTEDGKGVKFGHNAIVIRGDGVELAVGERLELSGQPD